MDENLLQTLIVAGLAAIILGPMTARSSLRRQPIHGGLPALVLHLLGTAAFVTVIPGVLTALIVGGGFGLAFPFGVAMLLLSLLLFFLFGLLEAPHAPPEN